MTKQYSSETKGGRESKQNIKKLFGLAVRRRRHELGISQEELADRAGLHRTYVTEVENGRRNVSLKNIDRLATALEVSLKNLFALVERG